MSGQCEGRLKLWIRDFAKTEGRKPQTADMPEDISKAFSVEDKCVNLAGGPQKNHQSQ